MRLRFLLFAVVFLPTFLLAQTTSISPYSGFGLGELAPQGYDQSFGMGGTGIGFNDSLSLNPMNPASYSFFQSHNPIFQLGYRGQVTTISSEVNSQKLNNGMINNIGIGFKLSKKMGMALGFNPATTVGYNITSASYIHDSAGDSVPVTYEFQGDGGYTKIFAGLAYQIFEKRDTLNGHVSTLSVGINFNFYTGNKRTLYQVIYGTGDYSFYNTRYEESQIITDFGFDLGLQYQTYLKRTSPTDYINLSVGLSTNIPKNLKTRWKSHYYTFSYDAVDEPFIQDTIFYSDDLKGHSYVPFRYGFGIMLDISNKWQIGVDFEKQNWTNFNQVVNDIEVPNTQLTDAWRVAAGVQYTILPMALRKMNSHYLTMITYRVGGRYSTNYLKFDDYQITDQAITLGFNFPLSKSQSYSSINIGMEFGTQGTIDNGLIKQDYMNYMIGVILLPHRFNKWFVKRKYN